MLGFNLNAAAYLKRLGDELGRLDTAALQTWADWMHEAWRDGRTVFVIGNGGAATTAAHFSEDAGTEPFRGPAVTPDAKRLKILSLADNPGWITAIGNDLGFDRVFVEQLIPFAQPGDLLIALSGSGNSPNLLVAVAWANEHGLRTFALTGFDGGKLKPIAQAGLHVSVADMGVAQSLHLAVFHWVLDDLNARINGLGRFSK